MAFRLTQTVLKFQVSVRIIQNQHVERQIAKAYRKIGWLNREAEIRQFTRDNWSANSASVREEIAFYFFFFFFPIFCFLAIKDKPRKSLTKTMAMKFYISYSAYDWNSPGTLSAFIWEHGLRTPRF